MKRRDFLKIATGSAGGAAAMGAAGARSSSTSAALQEDDENNTTTTTGNGTTPGNGTTTSGDGGLPGAGTTKTVEVGPGGDLRFAPETVYVQPGTTVEFVWKSPNHNVHATDVPEGADWDVQTKITGPEFTYEYTFDGPMGEYKYQCDPHARQGMKGTVVVNETGSAPSSGGEAEVDPHHMGVPFQAHYVGIATILMMIVTLVYSFFVLKYGESQHTSAPNKE